MIYNHIFTEYECQELEAFLKVSLIQQAMLLPTDNFSQQRSRHCYRLNTGIAVLLYSERFCRKLFATLRKQVQYAIYLGLRVIRGLFLDKVVQI